MRTSQTELRGPTISYVRGAGSSAAAAARGPRIPPGRTAMPMMMNTTTPMSHIAPSSKRSTISNANAAAVAPNTPRSSGPRTGPPFRACRRVCSRSDYPAAARRGQRLFALVAAGLHAKRHFRSSSKGAARHRCRRGAKTSASVRERRSRPALPLFVPSGRQLDARGGAHLSRGAAVPDGRVAGHVRVGRRGQAGRVAIRVKRTGRRSPDTSSR
jgi:hypothetical protein